MNVDEKINVKNDKKETCIFSSFFPLSACAFVWIMKKKETLKKTDIFYTLNVKKSNSSDSNYHITMCDIFISSLALSYYINNLKFKKKRPKSITYVILSLIQWHVLRTKKSCTLLVT